MFSGCSTSLLLLEHLTIPMTLCWVYSNWQFFFCSLPFKFTFRTVENTWAVFCKCWTFTIIDKAQQCLSQPLCAGCAPRDLHRLWATWIGLPALGKHGQGVERRLCVHGFCLKYSKQAVVSNDSHMILRWNKNSNSVFTYLDISTGLQVMSTWECSFSSPLHCLQNLIFVNHGVMLYPSQARIMLRTCSLTVEFLCQRCSKLSGAGTGHLESGVFGHFCK